METADLHHDAVWVTVDHLTLILALPISPEVENLIPSLETEMRTASPMVDRSLVTHQADCSDPCMCTDVTGSQTADISAIGVAARDICVGGHGMESAIGSMQAE